MALNKYICKNGEFIKASEPCLFPNNRAFRYGDSLCENIHACSTEPQFLSFHLERLAANMEFLSMTVPAILHTSAISQLIVRLLNKNRIFGGAGIRLHVYRECEQEDFIPSGNGVSFLIESYELNSNKYDLNDRGLNVEICSTYTKDAAQMAHLYQANAMLYLLAGMDCRSKNMDDMILLNSAGRMVETIGANLFLVSGNSIFTPSLSLGCIPGVMRKILLNLAIESGYRVNDQSNLTPAALNDAEEIFLTNAITGIRWVGAFRQIRYFKKTAKLLTSRLNELAFKS
jgi:branched-chain amino acid aminotransferase